MQALAGGRFLYTRRPCPCGRTCCENVRSGTRSLHIRRASGDGVSPHKFEPSPAFTLTYHSSLKSRGIICDASQGRRMASTSVVDKAGHLVSEFIYYSENTHAEAFLDRRYRRTRMVLLPRYLLFCLNTLSRNVRRLLSNAQRLPYDYVKIHLNILYYSWTSHAHR